MEQHTYTRESVIEKLLAAYRPYYNISLYEEHERPLVALCEFFEENEKYVLSRKANLWKTRAEEFIFLFTVDCLTEELFEKWVDYSVEEGMKRANIGPNHMYTYITPVFLCDTCDKDAAKKLKKCRIYKSFHFSLYGWMDVHTSALILQGDGGHQIITNPSGHSTGKILKKVLFS